MLDLTLPQLDWIVEMIAKDNPDRIKILRGGEEDLPKGAENSIRAAENWNTMRGKAKEAMIDKLFSKELRNKLKNMPRKKRGPQLYINPAA